LRAHDPPVCAPQVDGRRVARLNQRDALRDEGVEVSRRKIKGAG
jgi:hypothetical protein